MMLPVTPKKHLFFTVYCEGVNFNIASSLVWSTQKFSHLRTSYIYWHNIVVILWLSFFAVIHALTQLPILTKTGHGWALGMKEKQLNSTTSKSMLKVPQARSIWEPSLMTRCSLDLLHSQLKQLFLLLLHSLQPLLSQTSIKMKPFVTQS